MTAPTLKIAQKITAAAVATADGSAATTQKSAADNPRERPATLSGKTYRVKTPLSDHALYITVNNIETPQGARPYEVFINSKAMAAFQWITALTRSISAVFRHAAESGEDATFLIDELRQVADPNGGYFRKGRYVPSLVAEIGEVLAEHMTWINLSEPHPEPRDFPDNASACPKCGHRAVIKSSGCGTCLSCGHSVCG